ncbi:MAG TPA: carboxypeptidase-like regulatory domain-containing protein [Gemmatimonadales bacterium]|nr:carboxypeptidase-like regulatory domain-containing protein [Gemmatimonadales bacterium]
MRKLLMLVAFTASSATAQTGRRALEAGTERYLLADYQGAAQLLSAGLDPAAGPRDDLWLRGVQRLADALLVLRKDSLATTWLRWALRLAPEFQVDDDVMPPTVVRAVQAAQAFVRATPHDRFSRAEFRWPATFRGQADGTIRLAPSTMPIMARIGAEYFMWGGETRNVRPGSYAVVVSAPGYLPSRLTVEALPGVTTVVDVSLLPETAGLLYVTARPWAVLSVDGERVGHTTTTAYRLVPGDHLLRLERPSGDFTDIPIAVGERGTVRVSWITKRDSTGDPRLDGVLALLDSAQTERGVELLRSLLAVQPPISAGRTLALARMAEATWALGQQDSAVSQLRQLVRSDPFYLPAPDDFNPEIRAAYWTIRRETPAIAIRAPRDTVMDPAAVVRRLSAARVGLALPLEIAVGRPGVVRIFLRLNDPQPRDSLLTVVAVDSVTATSIAVTSSGGPALTPGSYALEGEIAFSDLSARELLSLTVERLPVDTTPHEPPPPANLYEPETRKAPPSPSALFKGLGLGALAAAVPVAVNDAGLSGRVIPLAAALVGGFVALGSIVANLPDAPIVWNVRYNEEQRSRWQERNRQIAAENAARLQRAPIRIRTTRAP